MSEPSKKRKRQPNGVPLPNNEASWGTPDSRQVQIHVDDDPGLQPVLMSSPAVSTPSIPFKPYAKSLAAASATRNPPTPYTHEMLLQSSIHPRLDYSASSGPLDHTLSHYVGIFDPSTNQLLLKPAYNLSLRSTLRTAPKDEAQQKRTYGQQREELNREFGTKKAKKGLAARALNAIGNSAPGKASVQEAILESMAPSATPALNQREQLEAALASKPIPRPNLEADKIEEIYPLEVLMPPADARLIAIKEWQDKAREDEKLELTHRFPAFRMGSVGRGEDVQRLKALRYMYLLLQFHDALIPAGKAGKKVPKKEIFQKKLSIWPEPVVDSIRRRFANARNELSKWHMDNFYTHVCALSLYVDGWVTDMTNLRDDLKMRENKELIPYFRELGCKVAAPTERERESLNQIPMTKEVGAITRVAKLRLPLDFPKASSGRRR